MTFTTYHVQPVLDLIGRYESRGDYDIVYGGIPKAQRPAKLTAMTIDQVIDWQRRVVNAGAASSAAGKYQIIRKTLESSVAATGMSQGRKFDKAAQDELAMHLLRGRGMQRFLDGLMDAVGVALIVKVKSSAQLGPVSVITTAVVAIGAAWIGTESVLGPFDVRPAYSGDWTRLAVEGLWQPVSDGDVLRVQVQQNSGGALALNHLYAQMEFR